MAAPTHAGVVLCGGLSRRMGRPKALLPWRGGTLVEHVVAVLREVVEEVVVVGSEALELPRLPARVVKDRVPELGPLGGIREALHALGPRGFDLAFVAGTDAPFLSPAYVEAVLAHGQAAACEMEGHVQTLGAVYETRHAEAADRLLAEGRMRPLFLLEAADYRRLAAAELPDPDSVRGFNTPEAYLEALGDPAELPLVDLELCGTARLAAGADGARVPCGTLEQVLRSGAAGVPLCEGGEVAKPWLVSLNAREFVRDLRIPIGPGERVVVMDASSGG